MSEAAAAAAAVPSPSPAPAVQTTVPAREGPSKASPGSIDSLVDKALAKGPVPIDREGEPAMPGDRPAREPRRLEKALDAPPLPDGTDPPPEAAEALSGDEAGDAADTSGTREKPYDITDLPEDRYIKVKVDGQEQVIPFRELADGYLRHQTFSKRVNEAGQVVAQARQMAERALQDREDLRTHFQTWTKDPEQVLGFFLDNAEETLHEVAVRYARQVAQERENPQLRLRRLQERHETQLRAERERLERERAEYEQTRRLETQTAQARKTLEPGWNEGLRLAGFPQITADFRATVQGLLHTRRQMTGEPLTADDVKQAVVRAARLLGSETAEARKPTEKPSIQPRQGRKENGQFTKDWNKIPKYRAKRDPDYWIRNMKLKD